MIRNNFETHLIRHQRKPEAAKRNRETVYHIVESFQLLILRCQSREDTLYLLIVSEACQSPIFLNFGFEIPDVCRELSNFSRRETSFRHGGNSKTPAEAQIQLR